MTAKAVVVLLKRIVCLAMLCCLVTISFACSSNTQIPVLQPQEGEGEGFDAANTVPYSVGQSALEDVDSGMFGLAKDPLAGEPVVPKYFDGLYGFVDLEGRVAIPAQFSYAELMREGLAYAEKGEDKLIINNKGEVVFKIDNELIGASFYTPFYGTLGYYDGIANFYYGNEGHFGYNLVSRLLDRKGNDITGAIYFRSLPFSEGLAFVIEKDNINGGYIGKDGNYAIKMDIKKEEGSNFYEGRAIITIIGADGRYEVGCINRKGDWIIPPGKVDIIRRFSDGVSSVMIDEDSMPLYGYMDLDGNWLIEPQYNWATDFINGKAVINQDTIIDKSGNILAKGPEGIYLDGPFSEGLAIACVVNDDDWLIGYVDEFFNWVIPPMKGHPSTEDCKNSLIHIQGNAHWNDHFDYYFNREGKLLAKNPIQKQIHF
ncbi:MAG: WG repeat-containing protein [Clostridiales bacterium]|nr:WG repeat-containing protein [Clostridiales bacterium]